MAFTLRSAPGWRSALARKAGWPSTSLQLAVPGASRSITSDGPFRYIKPNFVTRKKHYNEVLVMADRRKLLETAQEVVDVPGTKLSRAFWEVFGKRCVKSMHLFQPLELAIVARAFDVHDVNLDGVNVFGTIAERALVSEDVPGLAAFVLIDVFSRRLVVAKHEVKLLLASLGRHAANRLYELSAAHALHVVAALAAADVSDVSLRNRVAKKATVQIETLDMDHLAKAAEVFAKQKHRDLQLFTAISERAMHLDSGSAADAVAAKTVLDAYAALRISNAPEVLRTIAARAVAA